MSTLQVVNLQNPFSGIINGTLNSNGSTTFGGNVNFAPGTTVAPASGTTAPTSPIVGSLWYDTNTIPPVLKAWDGGAWVTTGSGGGGSGTVTSVSGAAPIVVATGTTTPAISITPATTGALGAVRIGTNINVTGGTISVPAATSSAQGAVQAGTNIDVTAGTISVKNASATDKGVIEIATLAESATGTDATRASTPSTAVPKTPADMTGAALLPGGNNSARPTPVIGMLRYNSQGGTPVAMEFYNGLAWVSIPSMISVKDFGAVGDGVTDDTAAINAALAASSSVCFPPGNYAVTTLTFDGVGRRFFFYNATISGIATAATDAVIQITGRDMVITGLKINGNFKTNYTAAIKWHSLSPGAPAQFIRIYDLHISYAKIGILYGQLSGTPVIDAPQSENDVFGYTTRGVEQCFYTNQSNGFITFHGGTLWSGYNEWTTGFDQANARVIHGVQGNATFIGCELLLTQFQNGRGVDVAGAAINIQTCTIEIANPFYLNGGKLSIYASGGFFAPGGTPFFQLSAGNLTVENYSSFRLPSAVGDNGFIIKVPSSGTYNGSILIQNSNFEDWNQSKIFTNDNTNNFLLGTFVQLKNVKIGSASTGYTKIQDTTRNDLDRFNLDNGITDLSGNWYLINDFGAGTTLTLSATVPSTEFYNSAQLVATGSANIVTTDVASALTRTLKGGTDNLYFVSALVRREPGAGNTRIGVRTFSTTGANLGTNLIPVPSAFSTWVMVSAIISTTNPLVAFNLQQETGTVSLCGVSMTKLGGPKTYF